jgi:hypothetical protein
MLATSAVTTTTVDSILSIAFAGRPEKLAERRVLFVHEAGRWVRGWIVRFTPTGVVAFVGEESPTHYPDGEWIWTRNGIAV